MQQFLSSWAADTARKIANAWTGKDNRHSENPADHLQAAGVANDPYAAWVLMQHLEERQVELEDEGSSRGDYGIHNAIAQCRFIVFKTDALRPDWV